VVVGDQAGPWRGASLGAIVPGAWPAPPTPAPTDYTDAAPGRRPGPGPRPPLRPAPPLTDERSFRVLHHPDHDNPTGPALPCAPAPAGAPATPDSHLSRQLLHRIGGRVSIQSFLTDGSLARLCDEVSRLTGVPIWLCDVDGRVVVPSDTARRWELWPAEAGARRAFSLVGRAFPDGGVRPPGGPARPGAVDPFAVPLVTSLGQIGTIVMPADWGRDDPAERRALERAVLLLAGTAVESCEGMLALRRRVHELDAMYRLSSLLVQARDVDTMLRAALDLALESLQLDAGCISMLGEPADAPPPEPPGSRLVHRAWRGLSERWLADEHPLSIDGALRRQALEGEVVCIEDLLTDPRVADHERPRLEGLAALVATGLIYQGRALGLLRLYARAPRRFTPDQLGLLRSIADHAAMAVALEQLRALREQEARLARQLQVAADVQRRMLPRQLPTNRRFDLAARYAPSSALGGDFYDFFEKPDGALGLAVGDVVGKGVPAALLMSAVRANLRAFASEDWRLDEVIAKVNRALSRDTLESEFCTMWCGILDPRDLRLSYCSAGHDPAILFRAEPPEQARPHAAPTHPAWTTTLLGTDAFPLGLEAQQHYEVAVHTLRPGDLVLAYTDGLSEARDFSNRAFGRDRIVAAVLELLQREPDAPAGRVVEHLMWSLRQFCGVRMADDDVTLIVLRVRP
jgi:sigma-B regulation protein RsbU (phosphoserine phosphatase)